MCQEKNRLLEKFSKPIICYKIMKKTYSSFTEEPKYTSLYLDSNWKLGSMHTAYGGLTYIGNKIDAKYYRDCITIGFFHAYLKLEDAKRELCSIKRTWTGMHHKLVIAQMIVYPKDNICFEGLYGVYKSISARKMFFNKVLDNENI